MDSNSYWERGDGGYRYMHQGWYNSTLQYSPLRQGEEQDSSSSEREQEALPPLYMPLDPSIPEIRLMHLLPAPHHNTPLRILLRPIVLSRAATEMAYECVSYVWGKTAFTKTVEVNGQPLQITESLDYVLRGIRRKDEARVLWVDAICINQKDKEERSAQVRHMREIYANCQADLVWVGPYPGVFRSADLSEGMRTMRAMRDTKEEMIRSGGGDKHSRRWRKTPISRLGKRNIDGDPFLLTRGQILALKSLLGELSPVWSRVWIMQEVGCAPKVVLVTEQDSLDWEVVHQFLGDTQYADAFHGAFSHGIDISNVPLVFSVAQSIEHQRGIVRDMSEGYVSTLLDVLARFRWTTATDPRDKIFGLLGMVNERHGILVDYNRTTQQVYQDAAVSIINQRENLDILCQSPWSDLVFRMPELPTWVPDFTCPRHPIPLFAQRDIFNAGKKTCVTPCNVEGSLLRLQGVLLDRIGPILPEVDADKNYKLEQTHVSRDPNQWMHLYFGDGLLGNPEKTTYATGEPSLKAYWRTLVADCKCYPIKRLTQDEISEMGTKIEKAFMEGDGIGSLQTSISCRMLGRTLLYWTFAVTKMGFYILVMCTVKEGDWIAILDGAKVPVVLRENPSDRAEKVYKLVSTAYVHGFMDGEAYTWAEQGRLERQEFLLA